MRLKLTDHSKQNDSEIDFQGTLKTPSGEHNRPIFASKVLKEA